MLGVAALAVFAPPPHGAGHHRLVRGRQHRPRRVPPSTTPASRSGLLGAGPGRPPSSTTATRDTGYKLFGGYQFTPNIGRGSRLLRPRPVRLHRTGRCPAGSLTGDMRVKGLNLDLVGTLPLTGKLSALGRVGVTSDRARDSFSSTGAVTCAVRQRQPEPAQHQPQVRRRADVRLHRLAGRARWKPSATALKDAVGNRGHVDLLSVGLVYRFGAKSHRARWRVADGSRAGVRGCRTGARRRSSPRHRPRRRPSPRCA